MPAIAFHTCICLGHGCFPPRRNIQASPNVFVNNKGVHRKTDKWDVHRCGKQSHGGELLGLSRLVYANNLLIGRVGDVITLPLGCGSVVAEGLPNCFNNE